VAVKRGQSLSPAPTGDRSRALPTRRDNSERFCPPCATLTRWPQIADVSNPWCSQSAECRHDACAKPLARLDHAEKEFHTILLTRRDTDIAVPANRRDVSNPWRSQNAEYRDDVWAKPVACFAPRVEMDTDDLAHPAARNFCREGRKKLEVPTPRPLWTT